jgi:NAD(P)H-nitrite reductase
MNHLLVDHFLKPRNVGNAAEPCFKAQSGSFVCGASARVSLQMDELQNIGEAKFRAAGCEFLIASLSILMERVVGKSTADAASIGSSRETLLAELNARENQSHCIDLGCDVLLQAIREYSNAMRDEWTGDEALICTCFFVSERTIESEIKRRGLTTVGEVTQACNAGGGCGSCQPLIVEILESCRHSVP